jgi:hypothetical protein
MPPKDPRDPPFPNIPAGEQTERLQRWHAQGRSSAQAALPEGPVNYRRQHRYGLRRRPRRGM